MSEDKHDRIRRRAYEIWEREGRHHGADLHHWERAVYEIEAEDAETSKAVQAAPKPAAKPVARPKAAPKSTAATPTASPVSAAGKIVPPKAPKAPAKKAPAAAAKPALVSDAKPAQPAEVEPPPTPQVLSSTVAEDKPKVAKASQKKTPTV